MYYSFFGKLLGAEVGGFTSLDFTYFYMTTLTDRVFVWYCNKWIQTGPNPIVLWNEHEDLKIEIGGTSACEFVYRGNVDAICRPLKNKGPILNPPAQEFAIQIVAKYGIRNTYMLYKMSCP
jgi:hypothetical protein